MATSHKVGTARVVKKQAAGKRKSASKDAGKDNKPTPSSAAKKPKGMASFFKKADPAKRFYSKDADDVPPAEPQEEDKKEVAPSPATAPFEDARDPAKMQSELAKTTCFLLCPNLNCQSTACVFLHHCTHSNCKNSGPKPNSEFHVTGQKRTKRCDKHTAANRRYHARMASTMTSCGDGKTMMQARNHVTNTKNNKKNNAITAEAKHQKSLASEVKAVGGTAEERNLEITQGFDKGVSIVTRVLKGNKKLAYIFGSLRSRREEEAANWTHYSKPALLRPDGRKVRKTELTVHNESLVVTQSPFVCNAVEKALHVHFETRMPPGSHKLWKDNGKGGVGFHPNATPSEGMAFEYQVGLVYLNVSDCKGYKLDNKTDTKTI